MRFVDLCSENFRWGHCHFNQYAYALKLLTIFCCIVEQLCLCYLSSINIPRKSYTNHSPRTKLLFWPFLTLYKASVSPRNWGTKRTINLVKNLKNNGKGDIDSFLIHCIWEGSTKSLRPSKDCNWKVWTNSKSHT